MLPSIVLPRVVFPKTLRASRKEPLDASSKADQLEARGFRELAVALGPPEALKIAGIIALQRTVLAPRFAVDLV
jgi:hypothetical protein